MCGSIAPSSVDAYARIHGQMPNSSSVSVSALHGILNSRATLNNFITVMKYKLQEKHVNTRKI
jgi:hypothetical protein